MTPEELAAAIRTVPDFPEPGIQFKDITPLLASPKLLRQAVDLLVAPFRDRGITHVIGIESRGFILGAMIADELGSGFIPIRKQGKLPWQTARQSYDLEYGTDCIEMHADALQPGDRVLIHDDVIATGGTAAAAGKLVGGLGAEVVAYAFLISLESLRGIDRLGGTEVHAVLRLS